MNQNLVGIVAVVIVLLSSRPKIAEAIVDGEKAVNGQFPWAIALYYNDQFTCTASLLSHQTVLTAAHCVVFDGVTQPASSYYGLIGDVNRDSPDMTRIVFSSVTPHPDYNEKALLNDIAVFQMQEQLPYNDTIGNICIAKSGTPRNMYSNATAMGWGRVRTNGRIPETLMYVEQMIPDYLTCSLLLKAFYNQGQQAANTQLCTRELQIRRNGVCNGDSGGPEVHLSRSDPPVQIGVTSYGSNKFGCGTVIIPSVATEVSVYADFIMSASGNDAGICTQ